MIFRSLLQGLVNREVLQIVIADPGLGKSVLCRRLLNSLRCHRSRYEVFYLTYPNLAATELSSKLSSPTDMGRHKVLLIDEAQALPVATLAQLTRVLDQQDCHQPGLQTVLFAQPELDYKLSSACSEFAREPQYNRYTLPPLNAEQTLAYIHNRLTLAGVPPETLMHPDTSRLAYKLTGGVPRLINTLMRKSLIVACDERSNILTAEHFRRASTTTAVAIPDSIC